MWLARWACAGALLLLGACGGNNTVVGEYIPGKNVMRVAVTPGLGGYSSLSNRLYASVTVCAPHSDRCTTIDNILLDTGSTGLRLMHSPALAALRLPPARKETVLANCVQFLDGSSLWGSVRLADVGLGELVAPRIPVQVISDPELLARPYCSGWPMTHALATGASDNSALHANGILGIGIHLNDCGTLCSSHNSNRHYYLCESQYCKDTAVPLNEQLQNPVSHFQDHHNGFAVVLPAVPREGRYAAIGSVVFGIGTHPNNQMDAKTLLPLKADHDFQFRTSITSARPSQGAQIGNLGNMYASFIDTGSNGLFFGVNALPACNPGLLRNFYCPPSTAPVTFGARLSSGQQASTQLEFTAANAADQFTGRIYALPALSGRNDDSSFDWGLPFFFDRKVFIGIEGHRTFSGSQTLAGPFYAF